MIKKIFYVLVLLAFSMGVFAADWSNVNPVNGSTIPGSNNELFAFDFDVPITSSYLFLNGAGPYLMSFTNQASSTNKDILILNEGQWYTYFFRTNGYDSPLYRFFLNKIPSIPIWSTPAYEVTESFVTLNWNDNPESDIAYYNVYRNGTYLGQSLTSSYVDNGLMVGENWDYVVTSVDSLTQESAASILQSVHIQDLTPPSVPLFNPINGSMLDTLSPVIVINYSEPVHLIVSSGSYSEDLGTSNLFNYSKLFPGDGEYTFLFTACDTSNNCRYDSYLINLNTFNSNLSLDINIVDNWNVELYNVKSYISLFNLPDYAVYGINFTSSNESRRFLDVRSTDIVGSTTTLDIPNDITAVAYCRVDADAQTFDLSQSPSYNVVNVFNSYQSINRLNCPDEDGNLMNGWQYQVYVKYVFTEPIPEETYNWGIYAERFGTVN